MKVSSVEDRNKLIKVPLPKSCFLLLTWAEYERGIIRGKIERRREQRERRAQIEREGVSV